MKLIVFDASLIVWDVGWGVFDLLTGSIGLAIFSFVCALLMVWLLNQAIKSELRRRARRAFEAYLDELYRWQSEQRVGERRPPSP